MERLIAWYRIGSSVGAVVALIVANVIPLFGVLFLGWNVWTILTIYWLENGVVGDLQHPEDGAGGRPRTDRECRHALQRQTGRRPARRPS